MLSRRRREVLTQGLVLALVGLPVTGAVLLGVVSLATGSGSPVVSHLSLFLAQALFLWLLVRQIRRREGRVLTSLYMPRRLGWRALWRAAVMAAPYLVAALAAAVAVPLLLASAGVVNVGLVVFSPSAGAFAALLPCCFAGVAEEMAYRGYGVSRVHTMTGSWRQAMLFQAIMFALAHGSAFGILSAAVFSTFATVLIWKKRNILACIILHVLFNFLLSMASVGVLKC